ncbi:MAG: MobF family relaxase, partial [Acidimicrobiales bacterium]
MITVSKIKHVGAALQYYSERDDYYREGGGAPAAFYGRGAELLGLKGPMETRRDAERFADVLSGKATGKETRHTPGYDVTLSAPKSYSVAALVYGDQRLIAAHDRVVRTVMAHIERAAIVTRQRGSDGGYTWRHGEGMVAALFRHATSRAQDSNVHSHCVIANATRDPQTGELRAIDSRELFRIQREAGAIYTGELAAAVRELGYEIEWRINAEGHPQFELVDVPQALCDLHSKRAQQVEAALEARGLDRATASPDAKQAAALDTRAAKEHIDHAVLAARWRDEARALGYDPDRAPPAPAWPDPAARREAAEAAVKQAAAHLSERDARFSSRSLEHEARLFAQGHADGVAIRDAIADLTKRGELEQRAVQVRAAGGRREHAEGFTTKAGIETERKLLGAAQRLTDRKAWLGPKDATRGHRDRLAADAIRHQEARGGREFSPEQRAATQAILTSGKSLHVLHGHAGTAKTSSVLAAVRHSATEQGFKCRALAPTTKAAEKLGGSLLLKGQTVASWIAGDRSAPRPGAQPQREAWIVDEAGMVSATDMRALLEKADRERAIVILAGDTQQLGSVEAGQAFDQIRDVHGSVDLTDIKRQRNEMLRSAVYDALRGDAKAALDKVPLTELKTRTERVAEVARLYMSRTAGERRETVVLAPGKDDRQQINEAIREARKDRGELGRETEITALVKSDMTRAEMKDFARYQPGMVIESGRRFLHGPQKGERCEVTGVEKGKVITRMTDGRTWSFDPRKTNSFQVYDEARTLKVAEGDRLIARGAIEAEGADAEAVRIRNGTALEVVRVNDGGITVRDEHKQVFAIGREAQVDHGYAQTVHQAQGGEWKAAIAHAESSRENLTSLASLYVTLS